MTLRSMVSANDLFHRYLTEAIGAENAAVALSALDEPASVSVRLNPDKFPGRLKDAVFPGSEPVPWSGCGLMIPERPVFTLDPFFHAGCYYVQDSSSMFVGHALRRVLGMMPHEGCPRVLDLCAAPGGKTTDAAASLRSVLGGGFLLVSNEVIRQRASVLASNVAVWGDPQVMVTSADPAEFGKIGAFFDIIMADVPCSGEGMFRKDAGAVEQWSAENVGHCAARQRRILADVWPSLAEGGFLIYSTCTFNSYENDANVRWAMDELGAEAVRLDEAHVTDGVIETGYGYSLVPGFVKGEGQYCAVLRKTSGSRRADVPHGRKRIPAQGAAALFGMDVREVLKGDLIKVLPESAADGMEYLESRVSVISSGCAVGRRKGKDMVPDADLALDICLGDDAFPREEVDRMTALKFLHRDAVTLPGAEKGFVLVCHEGVPLGFVKNLGSRCNNLHPQERRIRMDI